MKLFNINKFKIKYAAVLLTLGLFATALYGCNGDDGAQDNPTEENADAAPENPANDNPAQNDAPQDNAPAENPANDAPPAPNQTPIAEKSPMAITRIPATNPAYPSVSGADDIEPETPDQEEKDPHEHEPIPNLFPIDECLVEVQGEYDSEFARNMVAAINAARTDYMIGEVTRNTSLLACADIRCKEQAYFVGHFRPDGRSWRSVAPGYVQGECIAVDYRTAEDVVRAWLNVNKTRVNLMNPDYTQVGTSVYNIDGTLFVAVEFGY